MKPCKHTTDGYCLRTEKEYCPSDECNCPHSISNIEVISAECGCEKTVKKCDACNIQLTEPKIDC
jgi:hypothetical protein